MALSRIEGPDDLYVCGVWALLRSSTLRQLGVTHVLSLGAFDLGGLKNLGGERWEDGIGKPFRHLVIDVDDVKDTDLLAELPRAVRFIHEGLKAGRRRPRAAECEQRQRHDERQQTETEEKPEANEEKEEEEEEEKEGGESTEGGREALPRSVKTMQGSINGAVVVHCVAGKSRSVAVVVAYLLWRYPRRFDPNLVRDGKDDDDNDNNYGSSNLSVASKEVDASACPSRSSPLSFNTTISSVQGETSTRLRHPPVGRTRRLRPRKETAFEAVDAALALVRRTRPMAEPNDGFMHQLALWWEMGCPDDEVQAHPAYQRWAYRCQVEVDVAAGQAPSRLRFEDEERQKQQPGDGPCLPSSPSELKLRCKRCRRTLATTAFILPHSSPSASATGEARQPCPHYFVEPLGWMRDELEKGQLSGRLTCPNGRCGAGVGRYDWKGIHCACGGWVTPGLSLRRARVDEQQHELPGASEPCHRLAPDAERVRLGIRMPPGRASNPMTPPPHFPLFFSGCPRRYFKPRPQPSALQWCLDLDLITLLLYQYSGALFFWLRAGHDVDVIDPCSK